MFLFAMPQRLTVLQIFSLIGLVLWSLDNVAVRLRVLAAVEYFVEAMYAWRLW